MLFRCWPQLNKSITRDNPCENFKDSESKSTQSRTAQVEPQPVTAARATEMTVFVAGKKKEDTAMVAAGRWRRKLRRLNRK
jgi:hypothetical protein